MTDRKAEAAAPKLTPAQARFLRALVRTEGSRDPSGWDDNQVTLLGLSSGDRGFNIRTARSLAKRGLVRLVEVEVTVTRKYGRFGGTPWHKEAVTEGSAVTTPAGRAALEARNG